MLCDFLCTGLLPALERDDELVEGGVDEASCAQAIIDHLLAKGPNLDAHLSAAEQAEVSAFRCAGKPEAWFG